MALPMNQTEVKQFNPEEYPNDFHVCSSRNGKVVYGSIIHNLPFFIVGEGGKETEIGRYDICTKCLGIIDLRFNNVLNDKYKTNIHKLFAQNPYATFFFKDEVISGKLNENTVPKPDENFKQYKSRFIAFLKDSGYAYTQNNKKPLKS